MAIAIIVHPKHYVRGDEKNGEVFLWVWSASACFPDIEFDGCYPSPTAVVLRYAVRGTAVMPLDRCAVQVSAGRVVDPSAS